MSRKAHREGGVEGEGEKPSISTKEASLLVTFRLDAPLLRQTVQRVRDTTVEVEQELAVDDTGTLLTIRARGTALDEFEDALAADETVRSVERLGVEAADERRYQLEIPREHSLYWEWATESAVLLAATRRPNDWEVRMCLPDRAALAELRECCRDRGWGFSLTQLKKASTSGERARDRYGATSKQRDLLTAAVNRGYFAIPREVSLAELAAEFDISDQAASERLRRGLANHLDNSLDTTD
ncbi:helix-turn-helix domain-containing protein [Halococcus saccharolyticus]|uniref:helix-turn-helix domain-containing protein n=1 Tax=Halococcus saccharolyticus TaxID=62319 RepID=UPI0013754B06|nr:helix-turn-helix domain-containing protein [Halococcus saccharolyticus]